MSQNPSETAFSYGVRPLYLSIWWHTGPGCHFSATRNRSKTTVSIRKVFFSFWSIWCQTGQNYFSVSQHNVPQPSKRSFAWHSSHFGPVGDKLALAVIFWHLATVSHNSSKINLFVCCSSHLGPSGANLALVTQTVLKQHFRKAFAPFF